MQTNETERTINGINPPDTPSAPKIQMIGIVYEIISNLAYSFTGPLVKMVFKHNNSIKIFHILYWQALFGLFLYFLAGRLSGVYVLGVP